jgi:hypothetical protein
LRALILQQADLKGRLKAAKKVKAPEPEIAALTAEAKILTAQIKYARAAGLDPHRSCIRLVQLAAGENRAIVIDVFRIGEEMVDAFAETFPDAPLNGLVEVRIGDNWAAVKGWGL